MVAYIQESEAFLDGLSTSLVSIGKAPFLNAIISFIKTTTRAGTSCSEKQASKKVPYSYHTLLG